MSSAPVLVDRVGKGEGEVLVADRGSQECSFVVGRCKPAVGACESALGDVAGRWNEVRPVARSRSGLQVVAKRGVGQAARQRHGGEVRVLPEAPSVTQVERPGPADVDDQEVFALLAPC